MSAITLRVLAKKIGLSHTTVSEALRDSPRVAPGTKARVIKAAKEIGYNYNPLAAAVMSQIRRSANGAFRGVLAVLDLEGERGRPAGSVRYHRELARGARERAVELGFKVDAFDGSRADLSLKRIDHILHARGIRGIFLLPVKASPDATQLDWTHFSGIYSDYVIKHPHLHTVCPDHYLAMQTMLDRLRELGYRRPGLVMDALHDARLLHRWEASYHVHQMHHDGDRLPPLIKSGILREDFIRWFRSVGCDVVLAHSPEVKTWMEEAGARVPRTHGFCCLNVMNSTEPCAGLDLQPGLLGARGIELLIGQVLRNECGSPKRPMITTVPAEWVEGPTVRQRSASGGEAEGRRRH